MTQLPSPRPFGPRYRFGWREGTTNYELLVWPDDRYTLESRSQGAGESQSHAISAHNADILIRKHGLKSNADRAVLRSQLRQAFLLAAEGLSTLDDAERQIEKARIEKAQRSEKRRRSQQPEDS